MKPSSRREFLQVSALALAGAASLPVRAADAAPVEPVIDIHQHTHYAGRTDAQLIRHQRVMGVTTSVLLPSGRFYGLDAQCGGNDSVIELAKKLPGQFVYFANEVADLDEAPDVIRRYLKRGAIGIGEQKFRVGCDSRWLDRICGVAEEFGVPVLMHHQHGVYNTGIENFHKTLEKFPRVNFIGHAQTWGNFSRVLWKFSMPVLYTPCWWCMSTGTPNSSATPQMRSSHFESQPTRNFCSPMPMAPRLR